MRGQENSVGGPRRERVVWPELSIITPPNANPPGVGNAQFTTNMKLGPMSPVAVQKVSGSTSTLVSVRPPGP